MPQILGQHTALPDSTCHYIAKNTLFFQISMSTDLGENQIGHTQPRKAVSAIAAANSSHCASAEMVAGRSLYTRPCAQPGEP